MLKILKNIYLITFILSASIYCKNTFCKNILLEFKAASFFPTNSCTKDIYGKAAGLFGSELTFQLCENKNWYGFASVDFLSKSGHSIGLCNYTKLDIVPFGLGLKYFVPFGYKNCYLGDFYLGLGVQPLYLKTSDCLNNITTITSRWGCGGIAKIGSYFYLPCNFFIDLFFDYSFVNVKAKNCSEFIIPQKADLNGAILGVGIGYMF